LVSDEGDPTDSGRPTPPERLTAEVVRGQYDAHGRDILTFLTGVLKDPHAAQDVCQATFQRLMEAGHEARMESIRGWLFKVAYHEAMEYSRQIRETTIDLPPQQLVRLEDIARIKDLLKQLPEEQQFVVRQRIHEERTFAEIAGDLNVPLGTVLTRMRLAVQKLRKWFE
jgi:RNA polymerase sigma-70 factor (ECF subfamily)